MHITESENTYYINQDLYLSPIEQIPSDAEYSEFVSMRMKLAWLESTRPEIVFEILQTAQVARSMYRKDTTKHCKRLNKAIKYVHDHKTSIHIPKLVFNSLRITAYSDGAFANNANLSSQLG